MTGANLLGLIGSIVILLTLFEMMRRHRLREKYAVIWFLIAVSSLLVAAFPVLLINTSEALGLVVPTNLLFFVASLVLLILSLQHSYELGRLEEQSRVLAEEVALLRLELEGRPRPSAPRPAEVSEDPGP